jgi:hypothetical protein
VTKAILVAQFFRARAWWRLDSAGASALRAARSVVSLLDAAGYLRDLPDNDPGIAALNASGCFAGGIFDPGPEGWAIVRGWQLADQASAGPEDLLAQLVRAARRDGPTTRLTSLAGAAPQAITIPRQAGAGTAALPNATRPPARPGHRTRPGRVTERGPAGSPNATRCPGRPRTTARRPRSRNAT